jgi:hypothetical protein
MLRKLLLVFMLVLLSAGTSLASTFTILDVNPGVGLIGQINFKVDNFYTWGYCIEKDAYSYIGVPYTGTLRDLEPGQLWQAYLIYEAYKDNIVSADESVALQNALWGATQSVSLDDSMASMLSHMFKWASIPNSIDGQNVRWGQDFIVAAPVPEPASMILFGTGLFVFGFVGRKLKAS